MASGRGAGGRQAAGGRGRPAVGGGGRGEGIFGAGGGGGGSGRGAGDCRGGVGQGETRTRVSKRWVSSAAGSAVRPLCTGPGWTMVDLGAVSQRKRSPSERPDSGPSVQAFSNTDRPARTASRSADGSTAS